ncbi:MAG TPA: hypothetical protein VF795_11795 [Desulfuromonadaceae bacterium]
MKRLMLLAILVSLAGPAGAAGLGSTFAEFEQEWNHGYREVFGAAAQGVTDVHVGYDADRCLVYERGFKSFDNHIGRINGNTRGLFGAGDGLPTKPQFVAGIKKLIPADAKLVGKYRDKFNTKEVYIYKSATLASTKGIEKSHGYHSIGFGKDPWKEEIDYKAIGKFFMIINYDVMGSGRPANFLLTLGNGEDDIVGLKKVRASGL